MENCWICGTSPEEMLEIASRMTLEVREGMHRFTKEEFPVNVCIDCYSKLLLLIGDMFKQGHLKLGRKGDDTVK